MRVEAEHGGDQVLELLVEEVLFLASGVGGPELIGFVGRDQLVVGVLHVSHVERWVTSIHNEEDNAEGEQVDDLGLVGLACVDFGRHEAKRANDAAVDAGAVAALDGARKAEIDDLDVVVLVEEHILALKVAMSEATSVDVVNGLDELLGIVAGDALAEWARVGYKVKQFTTWNELTDDVCNLKLVAVLLRPNGAFIEFEVLEDVLMVEHVD